MTATPPHGGGNIGRTSHTPSAQRYPGPRYAPGVGSGDPWPEYAKRRVEALLDALPDSITQTADRLRVATSLLAHSAMETASGNAEWNYNLGNIRVFPPHDTHEGHELADGLPYRSYQTLAAGARDYVALLSHGRYAHVFGELVAGRFDAGQFAANLANAGYSSHLDTAAFDARVRDVNHHHAQVLGALTKSV